MSCEQLAHLLKSHVKLTEGLIYQLLSIFEVVAASNPEMIGEDTRKAFLEAGIQLKQANSQVFQALEDMLKEKAENEYKAEKARGNVIN